MIVIVPEFLDLIPEGLVTADILLHLLHDPVPLTKVERSLLPEAIGTVLEVGEGAHVQMLSTECNYKL